MDDTAKLVERTVAGDAGAWPALQAAVAPLIVRIAQRHNGLRRRGLASLPDDLAEIQTASLERMARADFSNLRKFLDRHSQNQESFEGWVYGVVELVIREHLRKRYGRAPKPVSDEAASGTAVRPSKRDLQSLAGRIDDQLERSLLESVSIATRLTFAQILEYIDRAFPPDEALAARLYFIENESFEDIAARLKLDGAASAERLIRRINARLRYKFKEASDGS